MNNTEDGEGVTDDGGLAADTVEGPISEVAEASTRSLNLDRAIWIAWWAGTALIVLSWMNVVSSTVGWIGFAVALICSLVSVVATKYWRFPK